jgi:hypothetical protein
MMLRDHPLMNYRGLRNWPPIWTWRGGSGERGTPRGEIGVLRDVFLSRVEPRSRVYLIMEHDGAEYMGCLIFNEEKICGQLCQLLARHCGVAISAIGSLDLSYLE